MHTIADSEQARVAFIRASRGFLAFPLAGAVVWSAISVGGTLLPAQAALGAVLFGTGLIFPLALLIARFTGQKVFQPGNRYATLMGMSVLMVNLLWALHLSLAVVAPSLAPLSVAIGLGIHWIIFGWIIQSPLGVVHAILRTLLCTVAWHAFPANRISAVALVVVGCYAMTLVQLASFTRRFPPQAD